MLVSRSVGLPGVERWTAAASYTALGFLAAVVVHSVARGSSTTGRVSSVARTIVRLAYACSAGAGLFHVTAAATGGSLPSFAGARAADGRAPGIGARARRLHRRAREGQARALDDRARDLCGLSGTSQQVPRRERVLGNRARGSPRVDSARVRDPVPGLPICLCRSVSQTSAHADYAGRDGLRGVVDPVTRYDGRRAHARDDRDAPGLLGRDRVGVPVDSRRNHDVRRQGRAGACGLRDADRRRERRASAMRTRGRCPRAHLRHRRPRAERAGGDLGTPRP